MMSVAGRLPGSGVAAGVARGVAAGERFHAGFINKVHRLLIGLNLVRHAAGRSLGVAAEGGFGVGVLTAAAVGPTVWLAVVRSEGKHDVLRLVAVAAGGAGSGRRPPICSIKTSSKGRAANG